MGSLAPSPNSLRCWCRMAVIVRLVLASRRQLRSTEEPVMLRCPERPPRDYTVLTPC